MKHLPSRVFSTAAAVAILCPPAWAAAVDANKDVRVINTPAEAVPVAVQGTATVTGGVQVTNTPTVKVAPAITDVFRKALCPFCSKCDWYGQELSGERAVC